MERPLGLEQGRRAHGGAVLAAAQDGGQVEAELGSQDIYGDQGRTNASVNFITSRRSCSSARRG